MATIRQLTTAENPSKQLIALTKKIRDKHPLTKGQATLAGGILNDHKNTERAAFVALMQATENKTEVEIMEGLAHVVRPKRSKAGRPEGVGADEHREIVLLAWRLKQRGLNAVEIGERLNVSNQTAGGYLREARELLRLDPATVDVHRVVGETLNCYDEMRQSALKLLAENVSDEVKIKAMALVLKSLSDRTTFLQKVGVLAPEVAEYFQQMVLQQQIVQTKQVDPVHKMMHALAQELSELANPPVIEDEPIEVDAETCTSD